MEVELNPSAFLESVLRREADEERLKTETAEVAGRVGDAASSVEDMRRQLEVQSRVVSRAKEGVTARLRVANEMCTTQVGSTVDMVALALDGLATMVAKGVEAGAMVAGSLGQEAAVVAAQVDAAGTAAGMLLRCDAARLTHMAADAEHHAACATVMSLHQRHDVKAAAVAEERASANAALLSLMTETQQREDMAAQVATVEASLRQAMEVHDRLHASLAEVEAQLASVDETRDSERASHESGMAMLASELEVMAARLATAQAREAAACTSGDHARTAMARAATAMGVARQELASLQAQEADASATLPCAVAERCAAATRIMVQVTGAGLVPSPADWQPAHAHATQSWLEGVEDTVRTCTALAHKHHDAATRQAAEADAMVQAMRSDLAALTTALDAAREEESALTLAVAAAEGAAGGAGDTLADVAQRFSVVLTECTTTLRTWQDEWPGTLTASTDATDSAAALAAVLSEAHAARDTVAELQACLGAAVVELADNRAMQERQAAAASAATHGHQRDMDGVNEQAIRDVQALAARHKAEFDAERATKVALEDEVANLTRSVKVTRNTAGWVSTLLPSATRPRDASVAAVADRPAPPTKPAPTAPAATPHPIAGLFEDDGVLVGLRPARVGGGRGRRT